MTSKMMKFFRGKGQNLEQDTRQRGTKDLLLFKKTVQHGFPNRPSAIAYDPKLGIMAIGTHNGSIKIFGAPGVECYAQHDAEMPVTHIVFLTDQGRLITVCEDNSLHLWQIISQENRTWLECVNGTALDLQKPKSVASVWLSSFEDHLYIGVESGNVHILNVSSFELMDGATITVEAATRNVSGAAARSSPGAVEALSERPTDSDQLLIGYSKGVVVLWDLKERAPLHTFVANQQLESFCWHHDGSRFFTSHNDGSYWEWDASHSSEQPEKSLVPYGPFPCKPIPKFLIRKSGNAQPFIIFNGGMPRSRYGDRQTVTVMRGDEKHVVFDFTSKVVDFFTICEDSSERGVCKALVVLLEEELVAIDLSLEKWPVFPLPYLFVIHSSSITCSQHVSGISEDVFEGIVTAGKNQIKGNFSLNPWPINGGRFLAEKNPKREVLLTGHEDGSVHFWDVSGPGLTLMCKITTAGLFKLDDMDDDEEQLPQEDEESEEWPPFRKVGCFDQYSDDPRLAVQKVEFCTKTNTLLVGGTAGQIVVFEFKKKAMEVGKTLEIINANIVSDRDGFVWKGHAALKVKAVLIKSDAGFQPQSVVQVMPPAAFTSLASQSDWSLLAAGTAHGFVLVDYLRKKVISTKCTLVVMDVANGTDLSMTRRKSFKKSLRESFRRMRKGRSQADPKRKGAAVDRMAHISHEDDLEARPVERQIEARAADHEMSSLVRCLHFASCCIYNNAVCSPTLWAGTNSGIIYIYTLVIPLVDNRKDEDVHASLSKEIQLQHRAPVVHIAVIDGHGRPVGEKVPVKEPASEAGTQKVIICSEEQFKLFHLPSLKPYTKYKLTAHEGSLIRKVRIVRFTNRTDESLSEYCLACLTNQGEISIFSIPNLTRLLRQECVRKEDIAGISTLLFTGTGQGFYQKSPSEFQRFTLSARDAIEPLCTIDLPDSVRASEPLRPPTSPVSHVSNGSPAAATRKQIASPESGMGLSLNQRSVSQNISLAGTRSPDTVNLNESLRSDLSGDPSVDNVRIFTTENGRPGSAVKSPLSF